MSALTDQWQLDAANLADETIDLVETVTWGSATFVCNPGPIEDSKELEPGGFIQKYVTRIFAPKYVRVSNILFSPTLVDQFPTDVPGEGEKITLMGIERRIVSVTEAEAGTGYLFTMAGPDES